MPLVARRSRDPVMPGAQHGARRDLRLHELMQKALTHYAPASVLVNRSYDILSMQGPLVDYLEFPRGQPTQNLLTLARPGLRTKLRALCEKASHDNAPLVDSTAHVRRDGQHIPCSIIVRPITEPREAHGWLLVVFRDRFEARTEVVGSVRAAPESPMVREMKDELRAARDDLQSTTEQLESANEELKASHEEVLSMNEELQSANEELQSANEELQSSKEELQSLNKELSAVNSQLQDKVDELDRANPDLISLLDSTEIATLFLDTELRVRRFTPGITLVVNLRPGDVGRPIPDFATNFENDTLLPDCRCALEKLTSIERHVQSLGAESYVRRVFPYRAAGHRIEGLIVTYTNISQLVEARRLIDEGEAYRSVVDHLPVATIFVSDQHLYMNPAAEALTGYRQGELATLDAWFAALFGATKDEAFALYQEHRRRGRTDTIQFTITRKDGVQRTIELSGAPADRNDILALHDVTEKRLLQQHVLEISSQEQQRVGEELHDVVLQDLTGLALLADAARNNLGEGERRELVAKLASGLGQLNAKVRALCEGLIPLEIGAGDLRSALEALCETVRRTHGLSTTLEADPLVELEPHTAHQLYRIAREAVTNAVRHGRPRSIVIRLAERDEGALALEIADDGVGFDESRRRDAGLGTRIMQYRCALLGGQLQILQREGGGTIVSVRTSRSLARGEGQP
jgi:two-component system, chemotaxis family, CheB/CheR fusion protein